MTNTEAAFSNMRLACSSQEADSSISRAEYTLLTEYEGGNCLPVEIVGILVPYQYIHLTITLRQCLSKKM